VRILLIDDHRLLRDALAEVLGRIAGEVSIFNAGTAEEARAAASHYGSLDLVLLDLYLPDSQGVSLLTELRDLLVTVPIVVLSASERPEDVRAALAAGASGYIPKTSSGRDMLAALRQILDGEIYVPASLLAAMQALQGAEAASPSPGPVAATDDRLTDRQLQVLRLLGQGLSNKGIANRLNLTEGTVKLHVSAILRALGVGNRTEAVMAAERLGLLRR